MVIWSFCTIVGSFTTCEGHIFGIGIIKSMLTTVLRVAYMIC
jgi:hypothetical protein